MDYAEPGEHEQEKAHVTVVVCRDKWTKPMVAHVAKAKGSIESAKGIAEFFDSFG